MKRMSLAACRFKNFEKMALHNFLVIVSKTRIVTEGKTQDRAERQVLLVGFSNQTSFLVLAVGAVFVLRKGSTDPTIMENSDVENDHSLKRFDCFCGTNFCWRLDSDHIERRNWFRQPQL